MNVLPFETIHLHAGNLRVSSPDMRRKAKIRMWKCDKCGEQNEDQFDACWKCAESPEGLESENSPQEAQDDQQWDPNDHVAVNQRRPACITVLAVMQYANAGLILGAGVVCLFGAKAAAALFTVLHRPATPEDPGSYHFWGLWLLASCSLLISILIYILARALWRLKNWARLFLVVFSILDLRFGDVPFAFGPFHLFVPAGPGFALAGRVLSFLLILYLLSPGVRHAFDRTVPLRRWLVPVAAALGLISLGFDLYKSKPEIQAIRWHLRHGDRASVNGVSFPIYYWHAPLQKSDGADLTIDDRPGPLRSMDSVASIQIRGFRDDDYYSRLNGGQRLEEGFRARRHNATRRFQIKVGKQSLSCLDIPFAGTECYGDGPIYSVSFVGGDHPWSGFTRMMAEAR
jgi:hypothetical protein